MIISNLEGPLGSTSSFASITKIETTHLYSLVLLQDCCSLSRYWSTFEWISKESFKAFPRKIRSLALIIAGQHLGPVPSFHCIIPLHTKMPQGKVLYFNCAWNNPYFSWLLRQPQTENKASVQHYKTIRSTVKKKF